VTFGHNYGLGMVWSDYLRALDDRRTGANVPAGSVRATWLVATVDDVIVGRASIRHDLNEFLAREAGHIGYCVLPEHRRRGYATEILRQSLVIIRDIGVDRVLITCDDDNVGSATVIERGGGVFESLVDGSDGVLKRRYWIG
jgi:predicted acetyltransferase